MLFISSSDITSPSGLSATILLTGGGVMRFRCRVSPSIHATKRSEGRKRAATSASSGPLPAHRREECTTPHRRRRREAVTRAA